MGGRRATRTALQGSAVFGLLLALVYAYDARRGERAGAAATSAREAALAGSVARYELSPESGRLTIETVDGRSRLAIDLSLVVDGVERPLVMRPSDVEAKGALTAPFAIEHGEERLAGVLELRIDPESEVVTAAVAISHDPEHAARAYALRLGMARGRRSVFVPGTGVIGDGAKLDGRSAVLDDDVYPIALRSNAGPLRIEGAEPDGPGARPRLVLSARGAAAAPPRGEPARVEVSMFVGASSQAVWGRLYGLSKRELAKVSGIVTGTRERAYVVALDGEGRALLRALTDLTGRFSIEAPTTAVQWYAAVEGAYASAPVRFEPGTPWKLRLDVSPGGELVVRVTDPDTRTPLVARLIVQGVEGTIDPSFGPDYRASGAGPLMDVLEGEVRTPLPAGTYRVSATKGIEWSVDREVVEIASGRTTTIELSPRRVVPTPGLVGCDLHVHARPSFDSLVTPEDRVLSLVSAGVDFAVPTEHNIVGDYGPPLELQGLTAQLAHVPGVEVTTESPRFGHFGVFPWPLGAAVPPYRGTTPSALLEAAKRGDPTRLVQINHPRLSQTIGFFNVIGFDPASARPPEAVPHFDTLEVYNGYELGRPDLTERVMADWFSLLNFGRRVAATGSSDSHRIQYQWAGYPRTYARVHPQAAGDTGAPIDTRAVIAALRRGEGFVTSGPMIDLELFEGDRAASPGGELPGKAPLRGRLTVRAAPWVDATSFEVLAGVPPGSAAPSVVVARGTIEPRPTRTGREGGALAEAEARTVRLDAELSLSPPPGARWIVAVVRGERTMEDVLPFMPVTPLAFTNPIYLSR